MFRELKGIMYQKLYNSMRMISDQRENISKEVTINKERKKERIK